MVIHDATIDRTTNGSAPFMDLPVSELRALDAGGWFAPHFAGVRLPTLAEMLDCGWDWDRGIYIEIKDADPLAALREVQGGASPSAALSGARITTACVRSRRRTPRRGS